MAEIKNKGWQVTWASIGINLAIGCLYAWSVYAGGLAKEMSLTKTQAMLPYTVALVMLAVMMVPGGRIYDRKGPKFTGTLGGIFVGAGFILTSYANSLTTLIISFGIVFGIGLGVAYAATIPSAVSWFPAHKRGRVGGMVVAGLGLSSVYVAPLTQYIIENFGVKRAFFMEGILFMVAIVLLSQLLDRAPAGYVAPGTQAPAAGTAAAHREYSTSEMMATPQFYMIWFAYAFGLVAGLMIIGHMGMIAKMQAGIAWGFALVSILAVFNASGRYVGGYLSDHLGRSKTLMLVYTVSVANMLLFKYYTTFGTLVVGIIITGICYGSLLGIYPALTYDYFGMKYSGMNYGMVFTSFVLGGAIGPLVAGRIADVTKSYDGAYLAAAVLSAIGLGLVWMLKHPSENEARSISLEPESAS